MEIKLRLPHNFKPRAYQIPLMRAMDATPEKGGVNRAACCWHRRSGKDKTYINILAKKAAQRVGAYYYYFPTQTEGRKIIWDGMDRDGFKFVDHFPEDFIAGTPNDRDMRIEFVNGSSFQLIGTDRLTVVGVNPVGCVFSEYSLQNPKAWELVQPILRENEGWAIFNFTPRGKNHAWELLEKTKDSDKWFTQVLTVENTNAINIDDIYEDIRLGLISEHLAQQEYWCSFEVGVEGTVYAKELAAAHSEKRIRQLTLESSKPIYTAWDLGIDNAMAVWFFQYYEKEIHFLDYYEASGKGLAHYLEVLEKKGYRYGNHFAPWDASRRDTISGLTFQESARQMGIDFERVKRTSAVTDDIELVRRYFPRMFFHGEKCKDALRCLQQWHFGRDEKNSVEGRPVFAKNPIHDWSSNCADAHRCAVRAVELDLVRPANNTIFERQRRTPRQTSYLDDREPTIPLHEQWHDPGYEYEREDDYRDV